MLTSFAKVTSAAKICDLLEISLSLTPCEKLTIDWQNIGLFPRLLVADWNLSVMNRNGTLCSFMFHIIKDDSRIIIGLDVAKYSIQYNIASDPSLCVKLSIYFMPCTFDTYITLSSPDTSDRIHAILVNNTGKSIKCMLGMNLRQATVRDPMRFAKNVHNVSYAPLQQIKPSVETLKF